MHLLSKAAKLLLRTASKTLIHRDDFTSLKEIQQTLKSIQCPRCGENETITFNAGKWECPLCNHKWKFCN